VLLVVHILSDIMRSVQSTGLVCDSSSDGKSSRSYGASSVIL
jgi:tRNA-binding EMAP/Myf-like protein